MAPSDRLLKKSVVLLRIWSFARELVGWSPGLRGLWLRWVGVVRAGFARIVRVADSFGGQIMACRGLDPGLQAAMA